MAQCARAKPWRCWALFHSVLYCCKPQGFGWLNIYSGGVMAVPRCHFTGADVCAAWLQTSVSLWWLFAPPPSWTLSLVNWCETIGFLLLGNVNPVLCPHGIQQWTLLGFEPCTEFWGLGKARVSGASAWIHKCKAVVWKTQLKATSNPYCFRSLCYWDGDAAIEMKTVGMQKLPWVENKTSHDMERNKTKNLSISCLQEVGKDFAGELNLSCS